MWCRIKCRKEREIGSRKSDPDEFLHINSKLYNFTYHIRRDEFSSVSIEGFSVVWWNNFDQERITTNKFPHIIYHTYWVIHPRTMTENSNTTQAEGWTRFLSHVNWRSSVRFGVRCCVIETESKKIVLVQSQFGMFNSLCSCGEPYKPMTDENNYNDLLVVVFDELRFLSMEEACHMHTCIVNFI